MEKSDSTPYYCIFQSDFIPPKPARGYYAGILIINGSYQLESHENSCTYQTHELIFEDAVAISQLIPTAPNSYHYLLSFSNQLVYKICSQLQFSRKLLPVKTHDSIRLNSAEFAYLSNLSSLICQNQDSDITVLAEHCIANILFPYFSKKETPRRPDVNIFAIDLLRRFNDDDLMQDSIKDIYHDYPVSSSELRKDFEKLTGESIIKYRHQKQLEYAARLLEQEDSTITAVAQALNFSSHAYFSACFKKYFGMTPTQYREEHYAKK